MGKTTFAQPAIFEENGRFSAVGPTGEATVSHPMPCLRGEALVFGDCELTAAVLNRYNTSENYGFNVIYYRERGGTYPLFNQDSTLTAEQGEACTVVTVNTPLAEGLHHATATTTLFPLDSTGGCSTGLSSGAGGGGSF